VPKPKPSTISRDPYAAQDPYAFIGGPTPKAEEPKAAAKSPEPPQPVKKVATEKITTPFPVELIERVRNAVYWEPDATLAGILVQAVADTIDRMERERGEPYPPRKNRLRSGRPIGTGKSKEGG
jgi:hypothetical protein